MAQGTAVHGVRLETTAMRCVLLISGLLTGVGCNSFDYALNGVSDGDASLETAPPSPFDGASNRAPVAVCAASDTTVAPLYESVALFGHDSYDPDGDELTSFWWKLAERPPGSSEVWSRSVADPAAFMPEMSGDYRLELTVMDEHGNVSEPCEVTVSAVPQQDLWVELTWDARDDLDLHLVQEGGALFSPRDCGWTNCTYYGERDWGVYGDHDDDPILDLDDIEGFGPENININTPAAGRYEVVIHDFSSPSGWADTHALLRIHVAGALVFDQSITISGEETVTHVADIDFPSGVVTPR